MLDPAFVRDHQEDVKRGLQSRGMNADGELESLATLENRRRRLIPELRFDRSASSSIRWSSSDRPC